MYRTFFSILGLFIGLSLFVACANIVPPNGGKVDNKAPKLLTLSPKDSLLNTRITRVEMKFDEFVTVTDAAKELNISPLLKQSPILVNSGKTVILKIEDSLLRKNTTYTITFGKTIRDLHEGNAYTGKNYTFSTGAWFDSLSLNGLIIDAESGKIDSSGTTKVLLYDAKDSFNIVAFQKPEYICVANADGKFHFNGLPQKQFRIFALKESKESLKFDSDDELIGFADTTFNPAIDTDAIVLSIFKEIPDTAKNKITTEDSDLGMGGMRKLGSVKAISNTNAPNLDNKTFTYKALIDTANKEKRTQELLKPIEIYFSRPIDTLNVSKILLSMDSNEIEVEMAIKAKIDSVRSKLLIETNWVPNSVYTLRLLKGFASDTSASEAMPSKYIFRSKSAADYGKIEVHLSNKFIGKQFLLNVLLDSKMVFNQAIDKEIVLIDFLLPGIYSIQIVDDKNGDGAWTTGELKEKKHAELVIPYSELLNIKAGWEHVIDFEQNKSDKK